MMYNECLQKPVRTLLLFFLLFSKFHIASAQSPALPNVVSSSSPTAAGLSRYIDFPVSLSNGVPNISIPIYTLSSSKLKIPITLSYHSGGIKVVDRTSTMGLGWTLSAGGVINRVVHGFPDDLLANNFLTNGGWLNTVWPTPVSSSATTLSYNDEICVANRLYNSFITGQNNPFYYMWDGQPDIYYFSAPNLAGKFLYRNSPDASGQRAVVIPYQPIKISNPGTAGAPYSLVGDDGTIYEFGSNGASDYTVADVSTTYPNDATSAWYLTKMTSADGTDIITFKYTARTYFEKQTPPRRVVKAHYEDYISVNNHSPSNPAGVGDPATVTIANAVTSREFFVNVSEINSKDTRIVFNYTTSGSFTPLQSIDVYSIQNSVQQKIRTYTFSFSQFTGGGANCLKLDAVTETGYQNGVAVSNPPYQITYASTDAPPYDSKAQDIWGYYNGQTSNTDLTLVSTGNNLINFAPEKRTPSPTSMMKGMIKNITYPTGGKTDFAFEANQIITTKIISVPNNSSAVAGNITTTHMVPGNSTQGIDLTFTIPAVPAGYTVSSYSFSFWGQINYGCSSNCLNNKPQVILLDVTDNRLIANPILTQLQSGAQTTETYNYLDVPYIFSGHTYRVFFVDQGVLSNGQSTRLILSASLTQNLTGPSQNQTQQQTTYGGGLRIKSITHFDPVTNKSLQKTYNYTQPYFTCPSMFQGDYYTLLSNFYVQSKFLIVGTGAPGDPPNMNPATYISNKYYLESPPVSVGGSGNSSIAYQEVEEMETSTEDGSTLGKTVYTFNTAIDYIPNWIPSIRLDNEDVRKQLLKQTVSKKVNGTWVTVKETQNNYNNVNNPHPTTAGTDNIKFFIAQSGFDFASRPNNPPASGAYSATGCPVYDKVIPFSLQVLYYNISRNFLASSTVTEYDGATPVTTTINYTYGNYAHMQPTLITTTDSKTQLKTETIKYPLDFTSITGTSANALGIKNLQNKHVLTAPVEKSSYLKNLSNVQQLTSSMFTTYHSTLPFPSQVSVIESASPLTNFTSATVVSGDIAKDSRYQPKLNFTYETSTGNTIEQQVVNGVKEVYLWGYNKLYPVAKITGSDYATSSALVNQTILTSPSSDAALRTELNKLRTGLPNAMVNTYTYSTLIGVTSMTDPAGRSTYYNYDPFGRLSYVQDHDQKVIKVLGYNYTGQVQNPALFNVPTFSQMATNTTGTAWTVTVTNTLTGVMYTYPIANITSITNWANLAAGTYNLTFSPVNTMPTSAQLTFKGINYYGTSITLTNVSITATGTLSLQAAPSVSINGSNTTSVVWTVKATNTVSGTITNFTLNISSSFYALGNLTQGTYNFLITPNTTVSGSQQLTFNGTNYTGTSFTLNAVNVNAAVSLSIKPAPVACTISAKPGFTISSSSITVSGSGAGSTVYGYMNFSSSSAMNIGTSYFVGQISGACYPTSNKTFTSNSVGGVTWEVTVNTTGGVYLKNTSSTSMSANTALDITFNYSL